LFAKVVNMSTDTELQEIKAPTRREAMRTARRTYVGRPCSVHGAEARRYVSNSACVACAIAGAAATKQRERQLRAAELDNDDEET
jgi:hypothetical protein